MSNENNDSMAQQGPGGLRRFFSSISQMANSPWGGGDKSDGGKSGDDGKRAGPRNPWTSPDPVDIRSGRKPRGPSALDELLKRGRGFGGGSGGGGSGSGLPAGGKLWGWGIGAFVLVWIFSSSIHVVSPEKEAVVTRLGSYSRTLDPGFKITWPSPIERVQQEDVRQIRTLPIGSASANDENFVLTRDQNIIDLAYEVRWLIKDPELYLFQIKDQEGTVREVAESAMRATVANYDLVQAIGPGRSAIEAEVQQRMQALLDQYRSGVSVQGIAIRQADPPQQVNEAFKEVTVAQQERESNINNARAYERQVLERARGDTAAFDKIYEQYKLAPAVTKRRLYYETMEMILSNVDKTIVEAPGVTPYLALPELKKRAITVPSAPSGEGQ